MLPLTLRHPLHFSFQLYPIIEQEKSLIFHESFYLMKETRTEDINCGIKRGKNKFYGTRERERTNQPRKNIFAIVDKTTKKIYASEISASQSKFFVL